MDIRILHSEYKTKYQSFKKLGEDAKYLLFHELSKTTIKIHSLPARVKSLNSFIDKIRRKNYQHPFSDMKDLVGIRVVCLFFSDIEKIVDVAKTSFEILEEDNKIRNTPPNSFEYIDHKLIAKLKEQSFPTSFQESSGRPFEIQIRTIAQDAWASISHIFYKKERQIPQHLKRDFFALHGLFYVADRHFDMLRDSPVEAIVREHENNSSTVQ